MNIAVKLPNDLEGILQCFPFLHKLHDLYKDTDYNMHLISASEDIGVLNLLPFKAFFHELDLEDAKSPFKMIRAYKNSKLSLQEYELYFCLTEKAADAVLGKLLEVQERIGFFENTLNFLFSKKIRKLMGRSSVEQVFKLLNLIAKNGVDENNISNVASREFTIEAGKELESYIVLDSDLLEDEAWSEFLLLLNKSKIVIYGDTKEGFEDFAFIDKRNHIEFSKLIYFAKGYITKVHTQALLSSYIGTPCFYMNEEDQSVQESNYFVGKLFDYNKKNPEYRDIDSFNFGKIFDDIYDKLPSPVKEKS